MEKLNVLMIWLWFTGCEYYYTSAVWKISTQDLKSWTFTPPSVREQNYTVYCPPSLICFDLKTSQL